MRAWSLCAVVAMGCGDNATRPPPPGAPGLERVWRSDDFAGCLFASPVMDGPGNPVVVSRDGVVAWLDPADGSRKLEVQLPTANLDPGEVVDVAATPAFHGDRLIVVWQTKLGGTRTHHHVGAIEGGVVTDVLELTASLPASDGSGMVDFLPANAYSRSAIQIAGDLAYVTYGNIQDIQPWHGWVFEIDLAAWEISSVLLTTPETDCGTPGESGSDDMICGGGVWSPAGVVIVPGEGPDGFDVIIPTGNGQLDLARADHANTLMRVHGAGLAFDPACGAACDGFDPIDPSVACMESCADLFIPRLLPGQPMFDPPDGRCDGKTFFECYALLDYDLGANSPTPATLPSGREVFVLPAKDGGVYLIDGAHLGTLLDRRTIIDVCGSDGGSCSANWAGMMVTQPIVTDDLTVIVPTFIHDTNHAAGIVALRIVEEGDTARLEPRWNAPAIDSAEALERFRRHTGRPALISFAGEDHVAVVDVASQGLLYLVRVSDGEIVARGAIDGRGQRFVLPLVDGDTLTITSCQSDDGPGHVERWRLTPAE